MKKFTGLFKEKKWRWAAGGTACLAAAAMIYALSAGIGARAESITIGGITFAPNGSGIYRISTEAELETLGKATEIETAGKTFQMVNDISVISVTEPATGVFAGIFDGDGHVITLKSVEDLATSKAETVSEGLLFGSVEGGTVKNLIVDVQSEVNYSRTSTVGVTSEGTSGITVKTTAEAPYNGKDVFSSFSSDSSAKDLADRFNAWESGNANIVSSNGKTYYRVAAEEKIEKATTYKLEDHGTDQFGVICGTLGTGAKIDQVYVKGSEVLTVTQNAGPISNTESAPGTRDKYFYYEKGTGTHTEKIKPEGTTVEAKQVTIYDGNKTIKGESLVDDIGVQIFASAPQYVEKNDELVYTVQVKNGNQFDLKLVSLSALKNGTTEAGALMELNDAELLKEGTKTLKYKVPNVTSNMTGVTFALTYRYTKEVAVETLTYEEKTAGIKIDSGLTTTVVDTTSATPGNAVGDGVKLILTPEKRNYLTTGGADVNVTYTLTIVNSVAQPADAATRTMTVKKEDIGFALNQALKTILWTKDGEEFSEVKLGQGENVVLKGTLALKQSSDPSEYTASVTVTPSEQENTYTDIATYKYTETVSGLEQYGNEKFEEAVKGEADKSKGNHLNAGIIAGTSNGRITNIKQDMLIQGSSQEGNTAKLNIGGITGKAENSAQASDLYLLGTLDYAGSGSTLPSDSILKGGQKPNSANWTSFEKYDSDGKVSESFDLAWLVKNETDEDTYFTYSVPSDGVITVDVPSDKRITGADVNYTIAYNARPSLETLSEDEIYVDSKMKLGKSGFYRLLNTYATDGYYHYTTAASELKAAPLVYPYGKAYDGFSASVVRTQNPLDDKVKITFENENVLAGTLSGTVYYEINSTALPASESDYTEIIGGVVNLPFEIAPASYRIVAALGEEGYIYPSEKTAEFKNRQPLPAPRVTCFNYYDKNNLENPYIEFLETDIYEAGTDMRITPDDTGNNVSDYELRYKFSDGTLEGADIMKDAEVYSGSAVIPESLAGEYDVYLYVEISKKNYDPSIYSYGPFGVKEKVKLVDYLNGVALGETEAEHRALTDDVVTLKVAPENSEYAGIQYMVSAEPRDLYNWTEYKPSEGIVLSEKDGSYVYARIKYDPLGDFYSEPFLFHYTFGTACASPIITPNTGLSSSGEGAAATIDPTSLIGLSSRTADAIVFFVKSDPDDPNQSLTIAMERTSAPEPEVEDGEVAGDGYKYFKIKDRWYRTANTAVEKYVSELSLSHSNAEHTYMYVTAVAIADGYKISDEMTYVYKVKPPQQVKEPEAAFETRFMPGGETVETATVSKGGKLSFYSVTPGATLYYAVGTEGDTWEKIPEDGVMVEGEYGGNFVVRVQAKKYSDPNDDTSEETMLPSKIITFVYRILEQELVNTPTATPGTSTDLPTTVIPGNKILLSTTTKGATIFYTTNGATPQVELVEQTNEDGTTAKKYQPVEGTGTELYNSEKGIEMPSEGKDYFTITAIAVKEDLGNSPEARFTYVFPDAVIAPYANIDSGKVERNTQVLLKNLTEGAVIYYNAVYGASAKEEDVAEPTLSSTVFNEEYPFTITQRTIIKAIAAKNGVKSAVVTFVYDPMEQLAAPTASIETGSVVSNGTVLQLIAAKGASVYYTLDGSDPNDAGNAAVMSGNSVTLNGEPGGQVTVKAYATAADNSQSEVVTFTYQFSQNAMGGVTANVATGSVVSNGTKIILMSDVTEGEIFYTTDGTSPIEYGHRGTTVEVSGTPGTSFTVKAVVKVDEEAGIVATFIYKIKEKPGEPTALPAGGTLIVATRVTLDSSEEKIYYTTDGSVPTKSSNLYSEPILINRTTTLQAIAVSEDGEESDVAVFQYTAAAKTAMPKADIESGQVIEPGTILTLWSDTKNATIYYTTDGTEPTLDNLESLLVYDSEGIAIHRSVTIKAVAQKDGMRLSNVASWNYTVDTIPAVEIKEAEAAKLAEEGLKDTNADALERKNEIEEVNGKKRILKESDYNTMVIASKDSVAYNAVLHTEEKEINQTAVKNVKTLFGDDYTILSDYEIRLKSGESFIEPSGKIEVAIPIPEGYENATLTVVTINSEKKLATLETRRENGMLYASTSSLKEFAVVGLSSLEEESGTFPYLLVLEIIAGAVFGGGVIYWMILKWRNYRKRK